MKNLGKAAIAIMMVTTLFATPAAAWVYTQSELTGVKACLDGIPGYRQREGEARNLSNGRFLNLTQSEDHNPKWLIYERVPANVQAQAKACVDAADQKAGIRRGTVPGGSMGM